MKEKKNDKIIKINENKNTIFEHDANVKFINNIHPDQAVSSQGTYLAINFERRRGRKNI